MNTTCKQTIPDFIVIADFGVFVELERGVEGLVPMSELSYDRVDDPRKLVTEGQIVKGEIVDVNAGERRITVSLKKMQVEGVQALKFNEDRGVEAASERKVGPSGRPGTKLGDVLKDKLAGAVVKDE